MRGCERELRDLELLSSPAAHVKRVTQLASCTWIDTHLHDTAAFVCTGIEELHLQYVQFSERAARAALKALDKYLGNADDNAGDRVRESEAVQRLPRQPACCFSSALPWEES